jgi:hypothetical protein
MDVKLSGQLSLTTSLVYSAAELPAASNRTFGFNGFNTNVSLDGTTTPPITKYWGKKLAGNQSLDLTALVPDLGTTINGTGLKVQAIRINNLSATNSVTVSNAVANPYSLNAGNPLVVPAGGTLVLLFNDKLADVAAGAKAIEIAATAGQDYQIELWLG